MMRDEQSEDLRVTDAQESVVTAGQLLKQGREALGLSVAQVAESLCLSVRYVDALESGREGVLPEPAFVRGYMRRYATLVRISADDVVAAYERTLPTAAPLALPDVSANPLQLLSVIRPASRFQVPRRWLWWGVASALVLAAVVVVWGLVTATRHNAASEEESVVIAPAEVLPGHLPEPVATSRSALIANAPSTTTENIVNAPLHSAPATVSALALATVKPSQANVQKPVNAVTAAEKSLANGEHRLRLELSGKSWVSIRDRNAPLLPSGNKPAGNIQLTGKGPFYINLGNAAAVRLYIDDKSVDLKPFMKAGVATLTLNP